MKTHEGMEVQIHAFLTSELGRDECSASGSDRFILGDWAGSCVSHRTGLDVEATKQNPCLYQESSFGRPTHNIVAILTNLTGSPF
jgi:hypothetical protein